AMHVFIMLRIRATARVDTYMTCAGPAPLWSSRVYWTMRRLVGAAGKRDACPYGLTLPSMFPYMNGRSRQEAHPPVKHPPICASLHPQVVSLLASAFGVIAVWMAGSW